MNWLPLAKFWYNTCFHTAIQTTPLEVLYGQKPPVHVAYMAGGTVVASVDRSLRARESLIDMLKFYIKQAQDRMKVFVDHKRSDKTFEVGSWVFVKLQPCRQITLRLHMRHKLSAKYHGPFQIEGTYIAYKLLLVLPKNATVHPVFHVPCCGQPSQRGALPQCTNEGLIMAIPVKVLEGKLGKLNNKVVVNLLVQNILNQLLALVL